MSRAFGNVLETHKETSVPLKGEIQGEIPPWLRGSLVFTTAGQFDFPNFTVNHFGDGLAILGKFSIGQKEVTFEKKFLQSDAYKKALVSGRPVLPEYGTRSSADYSKSFFSRVTNVIQEASDNGNHNIYQIGSQTFASNGQSFFTSFDPQTLQTGAKFDVKKLFGLQTISCHPLTDEITKDTYNVGITISPTAGGSTTFLKIPAPTNPQTFNEDFIKNEIVASIPPPWPGYVRAYHSFGMSSKYIVFAECPTVLNLTKYLSYTMTASHYCILDLIEWLPEVQNKFHIIEKSTGRVLTTNANITTQSPFFYLHVINCYDDSDDVLVVDILTSPNMDRALAATVDSMRKDTQMTEDPSQEGALQRFRIPLKSLIENGNGESDNFNVTIPEENLSERGIMCAHPNEKVIGKKYRYCYAHGGFTRGRYAHSIVKIDIETREELSWNASGDENYVTNDVTFVANPGGSGEEDDGILVGGVCDMRKDQPQFLLLLNAKDMSEVARVHFNSPVPIYTHSVFLPTDN